MNRIHYELAMLRRDGLLRSAAEHRLAARTTRPERAPAKPSAARLRRFARPGVAARG